MLSVPASQKLASDVLVVESVGEATLLGPTCVSPTDPPATCTGTTAGKIKTNNGHLEVEITNSRLRSLMTAGISLFTC